MTIISDYRSHITGRPIAHQGRGVLDKCLEFQGVYDCERIRNLCGPLGEHGGKGESESGKEGCGKLHAWYRG